MVRNARRGACSERSRSMDSVMAGNDGRAGRSDFGIARVLARSRPIATDANCKERFLSLRVPGGALLAFRASTVRAVPSSPAPAERLTGLSCPDCHGVLEVAAESKTDPLLLICRIGHTYSSAELIMAKEEVIEHVLWAGLTAIEELHALLAELDEKG